MIYQLFAFYEFGSHQNFQKWPFGPISRKSLVKLRNQNTFEKFKSDRNLQRIPSRMMYMSMLCHRFSNERWGGGGGVPWTTFLFYSVKVYRLLRK